MTQIIKRSPWVDLGNVLTTELNSIGNGSYSTFGVAYDNSSGLYLYGLLLVNLASLTPGAGGYIQPFMTQAADGTNYDDAPGTANPAPHLTLPTATLIASAAATKRLQIDGRSWGLPGIPLPAALLKFALQNGAGVSFGSSGNTVKLYGAYDQAV